MKIASILTAGLLALSFGVFAQTEDLKQNIQKITAGKKAEVGISIRGIENGKTVSINGNKHYPMQSVFKFPIALTVLHQVDAGKLKLEQLITIKRSELLQDTWSPLREKYPKGDVKIPLSEIIQYTVSQSDNNGCDVLLRLIGGPAVVNDYIHSLGVKDIAIKANEEAMHKDWNVQFTNWCAPDAMTALLIKFYQQKILQPTTHAFLWKTMAETTTGKNRIRKLLPAGTIVADKTGSSGANKQGITAALNDVGVVTLPNSQHFAITIFVSDSKENNDTNEQIIADIAKAAWDYFIKL
ncbi:class A beta-lactamase, subclass A2 [Taibaiella soli]|uniref:Beta-lactamase n=1 Tax=Taibaiella soli TaxID=1649169 RepID=A0A2W2A739_9BACT|nr:class A beta-lactamase, subclass A2 [Taibaiella soli]PZF71031.1 class A beta-lactamase, subclass A2 [Taibaiella soli]